ncbi:recombinase family protein [Mycobacterium avium]|uniref:recombinase family protein n=1 Tax=Mycobacterium avium TaxID=1764 RepID=UPI000CE42171|nr:recombinase family protein [Mycobacterium avium]
MARVLGRVRLSRLTDESTSAERQRELIEQWAEANGHTVVGWAEDLDVSGAVDPFKTPALGPWLAEDKRHEWDILCAWKLDRLGRDAIGLKKLFIWAKENDKAVTTTADGIDLSTPQGRLIADVIAFLAEGEREAIRERTKAGRQKVVSLGRWPGGPAPYGFTAVKLDGGGFKLEPRADQVEVIRKIRDLILSGLSMEAVAKQLNDDGVPSPTGKKWRSARLFLIMESKLLLGHSTYKGQTVRDAQGMPVMVSEPILEPDEWDRLQAAIQARRLPSAVKRTQNTSPLYGVIFCKSCGSMMYNRKYGHRKSDRGYTYDYYMCPKSCGRMIVHGHEKVPICGQ